MFQKATREARAQQLQRAIQEFCTLSFDGVDAAMQMGLAFRMLVSLKSLAERVSFQEGGTRREEEAFRLLGLEAGDMYAIGTTIRKATKLTDQHRYRAAFDVLCSARPWFIAEDAGALEAQRAELRAAASKRVAAKEAKKARAKEKEHCAPTDDLAKEGAGDWTEVTKKKGGGERPPKASWARACVRLERLERRAAATRRIRRP